LLMFIPCRIILPRSTHDTTTSVARLPCHVAPTFPLELATMILHCLQFTE
jgi:hypothetical protein